MGNNGLLDNFNDLAISKKILVAPIVVIIFLVAIGLFSFNGLSQQNGATKDIYTVKFKNYQNASNIYSSITVVHMLTYKLVSWTNANYGAEKIDPLIADVKKMIEDIDKTVGEFSKTKGLLPDEAKLLKQIVEQFPKYKKSDLDVVDMIAVDASTATLFLADAEVIFNELHDTLSKLQQLEEQLSGKRYAEAKRAYTVFLISFVIFLIVSITLSLLISVIIGKNITKPILQLTDVVKDIEATGLFSKRININSKDEIGQIAKAFNTLMGSLEGAIGAINISMEQLTNGDFDSQINTALKGDLNILKNFINSMINNVSTTFSSIITVMEAMAGGEFTQLNEPMKGRFDDLKISINKSMQSINKIIADISQVMLAVSNSDLTPRVFADAEGELRKLKESVNHSLKSISDTLTVIGQSTDQVASSADQTTAAVEQVAQGAQEQVAALSEVVSMLKTSGDAISKVSESANQATVFAKNSVQLATNGQKKMVDMVKIINNVSTGSEKISRITEVIGSISSQTNLLSLNAAIEAARAGVHGKGFAVVADEVRKLADDTAHSVEEISKLIAESVSEVNKAVNASGEVNKDMGNIAKAATDTENKLTLIASEMGMQEKLIKQINDNIVNLSDISENNASASEEITATTTNLADMIGETRNQIHKFKV